MGLKLITAPSVEPVSLAEAKDHLRVLSNDEDTHIEALVKAARESAESFTERAFLTQTYELTLDCFPGSDEAIQLPKPRLQSVTSVKYIDGSSAEQTWDASNYRDLNDGERGKIVPIYSASFPQIARQANAVTIRFVAGYGDTAASVPQGIKQAILLIVGHWYERREESIVGAPISKIPMGAESLLWQHRSLVMP